MKKIKWNLVLGIVGFIIYVLVFTVGAFGQTTNSINGKKYTYTKTEQPKVTDVSFSNGVTLKVIGSNSVASVTLVLKKYLDSISNIKPPTPTPPVVIKPPVTDWVYVGSGSGYLDLGDISGKNIKIKAGTNYTGIYIKKALNSIVDATGVSFVSGAIVDIGGGDGLEIYGFSMPNGTNGRAMRIQGLLKNFYLHDAYFRNVKDYTIASEAKTFYDGTDKTNLSNWTLENLTFDNCNALFVGESNVDWNVGKIRNVYTGFKFINNKVNGGTGNVINGVHSEDFEVKDNIVDGMNSVNSVGGGHNRILAIGGNGKIYNNLIKNHQGNAIAVSPLSVYKDSGKSVEVYNNIAYNSFKYGAIEAQIFKETMEWIAKYPNSFYGVPLSVHNNTVGKMNTSKDWEGQILDIYNLLGSLSYYNNSGFELNRVQGSITDMINGNGDSNPPRLKPEEYQKTNKYFPNWQDAVENLTNFKSKINGIGAVQ